MRIAQISPLYERVPPVAYGGTERVVSYLTEELVRRGHDVTLFASGDSITSARLIAGSERGIRLDHSVEDPIASHLAMLEEVADRADEFDVLHFHTEYLQFPLIERLGRPALTTLHFRLDRPDVMPFYRRFAHLDFVSISEAQRAPMPWLGWAATVHHGLPLDLLTPQPAPGRYLAFLGRLSREKGCEAAIAIARAAGMPLQIAGKIDRLDEPYVSERVLPLLAGPDVAYVGEINGKPKDDFLGGAYALLFPICWPEPFGLVMIEAMATGTPVVAFRSGSVPEILEDGVTGFIVDTVDQAVAALARVPTLDRRRIRAEFERRFSLERMTDDYLALYHTLSARELHDRKHLSPRAGGSAASAALRASRS